MRAHGWARAAGLQSLGEGIGQAIGVGGATWVLAKFLDAVGLGKFEQALFPLNHIIDQLNALARQVTETKNLVEVGIQATEHSQYNELVADPWNYNANAVAAKAGETGRVLLAGRGRLGEPATE